MPVFQLSDELIFPPPQLADRSGLLAVGGDLSPERLILAYQMGIFPWYNDDDPILWWSPSPRMILVPDEFHMSHRFRRTLKTNPFDVTVDTAFRKVIESCSVMPREGQDGTWILPDMIEAYCALHARGVVHSIECRQEGQLVGGLYGVSLGRCFFGESMFSKVPEASKVALAMLVAIARHHRFVLIDCQMNTPHLARMGAHEIRRKPFLTLLAQGIESEQPVKMWSQAAIEAVRFPECLLEQKKPVDT